MKTGKTTICILGLGYVGLPLAVAFAKQYPVLGFDTNPQRINELKQGKDHSLEVSEAELAAATQLEFSDKPEVLANANIYIITVPTPVNADHRPDLRPLLEASKAVAPYLQKEDLVIYESTVYPGSTEEECVPVLEKYSGLKHNRDFFTGYSPERINPGDKLHRVTTIQKVTSGSTPQAADKVDALYRSVISAGTHKASSIKVAEAAKVIENTQRDLNIALINELAMIFNRLGIDTEEVLLAAATKWNFLPFRPGLVGGHCISIDPYYLTHKAETSGYYPAVILEGRRLNDNMGLYVASQLIKLLAQKDLPISGANVLVMGFTFKENCPDLRNTKVIDVVRELQAYHINAEVYDPWVDPLEVERTYALKPIESPRQNHYDAILLAVAHHQFAEMGADRIRALGKQNCALYDLKYLLPADAVDLRL